MARVDTTWAALDRGVTLAVDERKAFVVPRARAHQLVVPGVLFSEQGALPHARPAAAPKTLAEAAVGLVSTVLAALQYAADNPSHTLLVVGHARGTSAEERGMAVATERARSVHALLKGDRDGFVAAAGLAGGADTQRGWSWAAQAHGYPAPPASGQPRDKALAAFRKKHEERFGTPLGKGASFGREDYGALYDLLEVTFADAMESDAAGLGAARAKVSWHSPAQLACGDLWPDAGAGVDRVDLLFFEPSPLAPDVTADAWPGDCLYRTEKYVLRAPIEVPPEPQAHCLEMTGMYFDTNRCFLLPGSVTGLRKVVGTFEDQGSGELLVVGHTDTSGEPEPNLELSLERAKSVVAYLTDDVDAWLSWFEDSVPAKKRWGRAEDLSMIGALADGNDHLAAGNPIRSYQKSRGLSADGISGPVTRKQLVQDYMALDATSLPAGIKPVPYGCGEYAPKVDTGDGRSDALNRRVELFLFAEAIKPAPAGETSDEGATEYLRWQQAVVVREVMHRLTGGDLVVRVKLEQLSLPEETSLLLEGAGRELRLAPGQPQVVDDPVSGYRSYRFESLPLGMFTLKAVIGGATQVLRRDIYVDRKGVKVGL